MSNARQGWNAAQLASERPLSGRKSHAPVGTPVVIDWGGGTVDVVHKCCGYHVCSCPEAALVPEPIRRGVHVPYFGWTRPAEPATQLRKMKDEVGCNAPKLCCCDTCWAKLAPSTPSLLTYDQAVAACREGKRVGHADKTFGGGEHVVYTCREGAFYFNRYPAIYFGQEDGGGDPNLPTLRYKVLP